MSDGVKSPIIEKQIIRLILTGLQEIIGSGGLQAVINLSSLPAQTKDNQIVLVSDFQIGDWQGLHQALGSLYGKRGAQGIAIRTGQVLFKDYFRTYGVGTGMMDRDFRMLAKPRRILRGLEILANIQSQFIPNLSVDILQDADHWFWRIKNNEWTQKNPEIYQLLVKGFIGVIQEFLSWTSGGKYYPVHEMGKDEEANTDRVIRIQKNFID
jgi:hypothetical protein